MVAINKTGLQIQHLENRPDAAPRSMVRATWPHVLMLYRGAADLDLAREWRSHRPDGILALRTVGNDREPLAQLAEMTRDDVAWWHPFLAVGGRIVLLIRINERFHTTLSDFRDLVDATDEAVDQVAAAGYWPGVLTTSEGNPPELRHGDVYGADFFLQPSVLRALRRWRSEVPRRWPGARVIWTPHGYSHPPDASDDPYHATRPTHILAQLPEDARLNYLLAEDGCDGGTEQPERKPGQGWRAYWSAPKGYADWHRAKRLALARDPVCIGSALFLCGADPSSSPSWSSFDVGDEVDLRPMLTEEIQGPAIHWLEPVAATPTPTPAPIPSKEPTVPDWCPFAVREELPAGLFSDRRDGGAVPTMICDHIADGSGDPGPYWISLLGGPESRRASAHLWVSKAGVLKQYVRFSAQAWSNGPKRQPDLANPLIAAIVAAGTNPNATTISIEHEGKPGDSMPATQVAMSRRVHQWLSATFGIPLDRTHVVGHYQFDAVTRANCPGPSFPWAQILTKEAPMPDPTAPPSATVTDLQNETYQHAHALRTLKSRWQAAGYPQIAEGIDAAGNAAERFVSTSKGEK